MIFDLTIVRSQKGKIGFVTSDLEQESYLIKRFERGKVELVVQELKRLDKDLNKKYFMLISVFACPKFSMPEPLDRFLGTEGVEDKARRVDDIREAIMYHIGFRKKSIIRIDGQLIRGETGMSLQEVKDIEQQQVIYDLTRDWIFNSLRKYNWTDNDLRLAFKCLFVGIPKEEYDKIFKQ